MKSSQIVWKSYHTFKIHAVFLAYLYCFCLKKEQNEQNVQYLYPRACKSKKCILTNFSLILYLFKTKKNWKKYCSFGCQSCFRRRFSPANNENSLFSDDLGGFQFLQILQPQGIYFNFPKPHLLEHFGLFICNLAPLFMSHL